MKSERNGGLQLQLLLQGFEKGVVSLVGYLFMSKIKKSMSIFVALLFVPRRNKESRNRSLTLNQLKKKKKKEKKKEEEERFRV